MVYTYFQGRHGNFLYDILVKIETDLYNDFKSILLGNDYQLDNIIDSLSKKIVDIIYYLVRITSHKNSVVQLSTYIEFVSVRTDV